MGYNGSSQVGSASANITVSGNDNDKSQGSNLTLEESEQKKDNIDQCDDFCVLRILAGSQKVFLKEMIEFKLYATQLTHMLLLSNEDLEKIYPDEYGKMHPDRCIIIGARGTGKTILLKEVCDKLKNPKEILNSFQQANGNNISRVVDDTYLENEFNLKVQKIVERTKFLEYPVETVSAKKVEGNWEVFWKNYIISCIKESCITQGANSSNLKGLKFNTFEQWLQKNGKGIYLFIDIDDWIQQSWGNIGDFQECYKNLTGVLQTTHSKLRKQMVGGVLACLRKETAQVLDVNSSQKTNLSDIWDRHYKEYVTSLIKASISTPRGLKGECANKECHYKCSFKTSNKGGVMVEPENYVSALFQHIKNSDRRPRSFTHPFRHIVRLLPPYNDSNKCNLRDFDTNVKKYYKENYLMNCLDVFPYTCLEICQSKKVWETHKEAIVKIIERFIKMYIIFDNRSRKEWEKDLKGFINSYRDEFEKMFGTSTVVKEGRWDSYYQNIPEKIISYFIDVRILAPSDNGEYKKENKAQEKCLYSISNFLKYIYLDQDMFYWNEKKGEKEIYGEFFKEYE